MCGQALGDKLDGGGLVFDFWVLGVFHFVAEGAVLGEVVGDGETVGQFGGFCLLAEMWWYISVDGDSVLLIDSTRSYGIVPVWISSLPEILGGGFS